MARQRILIMGAAGRDFHNFNVYFRDNPAYDVIAFTATQIPGIDGRIYPRSLAGQLYPTGIPIEPEERLLDLIRSKHIDQVVFSYSDVAYPYVMHRAESVIAAGADFRLMSARNTMLHSNKPVIAVCAVRTGCGKSQTTRYVGDVLKEMGLKTVMVRHPMPYGDLAQQAVQRFADYADLDRHRCTIEEREEYEPHLDSGYVVYAGVDYAAILAEAEREADVILWDGGNNDLPFYAPDLHIVVTDPHRPGHEIAYHPGEANLRMANVVVINKVDTADYQNVLTVRNNTQTINPEAVIVEAASPLSVDRPEAIRGKCVLVIEDGPTLTHGEMSYGAGVVAARRFAAKEIVDPREFAVGSIRAVYNKYPTVGAVLPAMGYGAAQIAELETTIRNAAAAGVELVIAATPIDLRRVLKVDLPLERVRYDLQVIGTPTLASLLREKMRQIASVATA